MVLRVLFINAMNDITGSLGNSSSISLLKLFDMGPVKCSNTIQVLDHILAISSHSTS